MDYGQLMFVLGSIVLYPQCRIELSVLRQQMLESGGKKILLSADAVERRDAEEAFSEALDKALEKLRKVLPCSVHCNAHAAHAPFSSSTSICQAPRKPPVARSLCRWCAFFSICVLWLE